MWIVKNVLRGTLYLKDIGVRIPPKEYFDLDGADRQRAEGSAQVRLAFEEGYLQNVRKTEFATAGAPEMLGSRMGVTAPPAPPPSSPLRYVSAEVPARAEGFGRSAAPVAVAPPPPPASDVAAQLQDLKRLLALRAGEDRRKPIEELKVAIAQGLQTDAILRQLTELKQALKAPPPAAAPVATVDARAVASALGGEIGKLERDIADLKQALRAAPLPLPGPAAAAGAEAQAAASAILAEVGKVERELAELKLLVRSAPAPVAGAPVDSQAIASAVGSMVGREIGDLRRSLASDAAPRPDLSAQFAEIRSQLVGDLREVMKELAVRRRAALGDLPPGGLSEAELKLHLAALEEQERALGRNFDQAGRKEFGPGGADATADQLLDQL